MIGPLEFISTFLDSMDVDYDQEVYDKVIVKEYFHLMMMSAIYPKIRGRLWRTVSVLQFVSYFGIFLFHSITFVKTAILMIDINFVLFSQTIHYLVLMCLAVALLVCGNKTRRPIAHFHIGVLRRFYNYQETHDEENVARIHQEMMKERKVILAIPLIVAATVSCVLVLAPYLDQYGTFNVEDIVEASIEVQTPLVMWYPFPRDNIIVLYILILLQGAVVLLTGLLISAGGLVYVVMVQNMCKEDSIEVRTPMLMWYPFPRDNIIVLYILILLQGAVALLTGLLISAGGLVYVVMVQNMCKEDSIEVRTPMLMWYPFPRDNIIVLYILILLQGAATLLTGLLISAGGLVYIVMVQNMCKEYAILNHKLDSLEERAAELFCKIYRVQPPKHKFDDSRYGHCMNVCLKRVYEHHLTVLKAYEECTSVVAPPILISFCGGTIIIALSMISVSSGGQLPGTAIAGVVLCTIEIIYMYLFSGLGQKLTDLSEELRMAMYNVRWYHSDPRLKSSLGIMQIATVKPLVIGIYGMLPATLETFSTVIVKEYFHLLMMSAIYPKIRGRLWRIVSVLQFVSFFGILLYHAISYAKTAILMIDINFVLFSQVVHYLVLMLMAITLMVCTIKARRPIAHFHIGVLRRFYNYQEPHDEENVARIHEEMMKERKVILVIPLIVAATVSCVLVLVPNLDQYGTFNVEDIVEDSIEVRTPLVMWYPFPRDNIMVLYILILLQGAMVLLTGLLVSAGGLVYVVMVQNMCKEYAILNHKLDSLEERAAELFCKIYRVQPPKHKFDDSRYGHCMNVCLKRVYEHHLTVLKAYEDCTSVVAPPLLIVSCGGTIIIALSMISVSSGSQLPGTAFAGVVFCTIEVIYMFLFNGMGQKLTDLSEELRMAMYNVRWYHSDPRLKSSLGIMQIATVKPLVIGIYGMLPATLETFSTILNTAYSFYNLAAAANI